MSDRKELRCRNCDHLVAVVTFPSPARPSECGQCAPHLLIDDPFDSTTIERVFTEYVGGRRIEVVIDAVTHEGVTTHEALVHGPRRETLELMDLQTVRALHSALGRMIDAFGGL